MPIPEGLFLRPADDADAKVYSNGQGLLLENSDGSTNEIVIGTFENDRLTPYNIEDEDDGAGDGDDISIKYSYNKLASNLSDDYRNAYFSISENVLSFTGVNSGVLGETPPYKLSIETALNVEIALPATFDGYIDVDTSNDNTDANTRKFSFSGGTISNTDVAATGEEAAYRTIDVTEGKIYVADATKATGKIINFEALDSDKLPATEGIYQYYVIVTDENNDGTGEVSAVAELPTGTEFYVIGTTEAYEVPGSITLDGIKFTDKAGSPASHDIKIKFVHKTTNNVEVEVIDGNTISIKADQDATTFSELVTALDIDAVKALVGVTTVSGYNSSNLAYITNGNIVKTELSGGTGDATSGTKAQVNIGGLIIEAATAGATGNNIAFSGQSSGVEDSTVSILENISIVFITFGSQATLADMIRAINEGTSQDAVDTNALVDFVGDAGTDYDPSTLLTDVLFALHSFAEEGNSRTLKVSTEDPTANGTGKAQTGAHTWTDEARLGTEDYIINLSPQ